MEPHLRRQGSEWRATADREYAERELAGESATLSALQSDDSAECDDLSRLRSQPEVRLTTEAESATELLSAPCGGNDQASCGGRGVGVFDSALDTRQRRAGDYAADHECRRAEPGGAADVQTRGRSFYAVGRGSVEGALVNATARHHRISSILC